MPAWVFERAGVLDARELVDAGALGAEGFATVVSERGGGAARMSVARRATADAARRRGNPAKLPGTTMAHREEPQWWAGLGAGTHWVEGPVVAPAQE